MEIGIYDPPPRSPSPSPPPRRKYRQAIVMVALFLGCFGVTLGVLNRHELARMLSNHAAKPAVTAARPSAPVPKPKATASTNGQPVPPQSQAAVMPPSVFQ